MIRTLRLHLTVTWANYVTMGVLTLVFFTVSVLFPNNGIILGYYSGWSVGMAMAVAMMGIGYTTTMLQMALSMGEQRKNYFWGTQLSALVNALVATLSIGSIRLAPIWEGHELANMAQNVPLLWMIFFCFTLTMAGTMIGMLIQKSRWMGILGSSVLFVGMMIMLIVAEVCWVGTGWRRWIVVGITLGATILLAVSEVVFGRFMAKATVK